MYINLFSDTNIQLIPINNMSVKINRPLNGLKTLAPWAVGQQDTLAPSPNNTCLPKL